MTERLPVTEEEKSRALVRIVDDEESVRSALSLMLGIEGWETADYGSARDFLIADDSSRPGCLILDVRMPGMSGLELQRLMAERRIAIPIIFLTGYADIDVAIQSLKEGASDFLLKPVDDEKLLAAIGTAVHRDAVSRAGLGGEASVRAAVDRLSDREKDILRAFAAGKTDAQVARASGISERTVQGHRAKIYQKFGIHSARELALLMPDIAKVLSP
ncbi:MAG: response regulator [Sutterella sp.]|nr:response regulator [Sutterella sp.]